MIQGGYITLFSMFNEWLEVNTKRRPCPDTLFATLKGADQGYALLCNLDAAG